MDAPTEEQEGSASIDDGAISTESVKKDDAHTHLPSDLREQLLDRLSCSDAHFKHQQRGEPDLTQQEKYEIASKILDANKSTFLNRFGKYLNASDLKFFKQFECDYMVKYYIEDIKKHLDSQKNDKEIRNRRYEAMKQMTAEGTYFSESEMKARDPLLYEQLIGQYLTAEEVEEAVAKSIDKSDLRFSSVLMGFIENKHEGVLHDWLKEREDDQIEESDEESDEEVDECERPQPSDGEKMHLRNEFIQIMQERFIEGDDKGFDYRQVDTNVNYDSLKIRQQDEEEQYFDEEDPENISMETDCNITNCQTDN